MIKFIEGIYNLSIYKDVKEDLTSNRMLFILIMLNLSELKIEIKDQS